MVVGFIIFQLFLQFFNGRPHLLRMSILGLQYKKVVLHVMVNAPHTLFFIYFVLNIRKLHAKPSRTVLHLPRIADICRQINSAEA